MSDRSQSTADERDPLAARLRREASQTAPEFSQDLHARVMQAVGQAQRASPARHGGRWIAIALVAAAIAIAVGVWMRIANREVVRTPAPVDLSEFVPPIPTDGFRRMRDDVEEQRLAYLDRDARQLANFVVAQLSNTIPPDRAAVVP